ncbi:recombinase RecX [beta proteobacterium AAP121]|nr:recombinase RecX [beta proteobacterium AAP65]KPF95550.1 recombinase RecX [beta proteobacterium AAP121]
MGFGALSVKGRALRHLAQREHSRAELERKLGRHVQDTDEATAAAQIAAALDDLAAKGLLSEERTAESVLQGQGRRHGVRRLRQTLQHKGLAPALVASTLQQARATEYERALEVWRRRFGEPPADAAERAKQMRFLAGRGFEAEVIQRVVRGAGDDADG